MKRLCLTFIALAVAFCAFPAAAGEVLTFTERASVNSNEVTLADLLDKGVKPSPSTMARLASVRISYAPSLGQSQTISGRLVRDRLGKARLGGQVSVLIPASITVVRAVQYLAPADLAEIYTKKVQERLASRGIRGDVHSVSASRGLKLPEGELSTNLRFAKPILLGRVPATVEINVDGRRVGSIRVVGVIDVFGPVVVVARTLPRKHLIAEEDLKLVEMNLAEAGANFITSLDEVVGMTTRVLLTAGRPVEHTLVERAALIKRGQVVTMICNAPGLKVTARGKAMQTGYKDGRIRLTNLISKREVHGTVLDSGTVVVNF